MFSKVLTEMKTQPISFTGSIASIIALVNTFFAAPSLLFGEQTAPQVNLNIAIAVCLFLLLEGALAAVFSKLYVYLRGLGEGFPLIFICINGIVSAWVTSYNCLWMFSGTGKNYNELAVFALSMFVAWLISTYFLHHHFKVKYDSSDKGLSTDAKERLKNSCNSDFWISFAINLIAFFFVFFYMANVI